MGLFSKAKSFVKKALSPVKKVAQKLVPKEAAGIMQMAAPFMGPYAGPIMYGLGSLKQRGKINPLGMLMSVAPHLRFKGYEGTGLGGRWKFGGYGGETGIGSRSLRDMLLKGYSMESDYPIWDEARGMYTKQMPDYKILAPYEGRGVEPLLGGAGEWVDKALYGRPDMGPLDAPFMGPGQGPTRGLLGEAGQYGLGTSKLADIALGGEKGFDEGISTLKAVSWGSAIVGGIQAGKFKDAQEAAQAAEDAARADGITDEAWIMAARAEAEALWSDWDATFEPQGGYLAKGGRVGYQLGVGPVGGIGAMAPQLPMMQQPMQQPMMQQPMQQPMQNPPPREGGLGRLPIEADMRYTGGFMPYGETEKADDVPARLSKNEFVFTADAVKAAGGGSVNKGAKKLYDTMKQLEAMS